MKKIVLTACTLALAFAGGLYLTAEEAAPEPAPAAAAEAQGPAAPAETAPVEAAPATPIAVEEPLFESTAGGCSISLQCDYPPPTSVSCSSPNPDCGVTSNGRCVTCNGAEFCCAEEPCFPRKCLHGTSCSCHQECGVGSCINGTCNCLA